MKSLSLIEVDEADSGEVGTPQKSNLLQHKKTPGTQRTSQNDDELRKSVKESEGRFYS